MIHSNIMKRSSLYILQKDGPRVLTHEQWRLTLWPCIRLQKGCWSQLSISFPSVTRKAGETQIHLHAGSVLQYNSQHGNVFSPLQCFAFCPCLLNRLICSLLPASTKLLSLLQACTCTLPPTKNFRNDHRAQQVDSSSQMKTMHCF